MVHMDLSTDPPRYVPDEIALVPGGLVQLMLFGDAPAHSLTLDEDPSRSAEVLPGAEMVRAAEFRAPDAPGRYPFHDKHSGARGLLVVSAGETTIGVREQGYDLKFAPDRVEAAPETVVAFRANGTFAHTLTSDDGAWADVVLEPGEDASFVAPSTPGEYPFHCRYHKDGGMVGVLVVTAPPPGPDEPSEAVASKETPLGSALALLCLAGVAGLLGSRRADR